MTSNLTPSPQPQMGMIIPGYYAGTDWTSPWALAQPAAIKALGCTAVALQTTYTPATQTSVEIGPCSVPDAGLAAMCAAAHAAGLKVTLKPHCTPADGTAQSTYMPGCQTNSNGLVSWTQGQPGFTVQGLALTKANEGHRLVTPYGALAGTQLTDYGRTTPQWPTIETVTGPTTGTLRTPPTWTVDSTAVQVLVLSRTAASTWFAQWEAEILRQLCVCAAVGGVEAVNISTEQDWLTCYCEPQWRALIRAIRAEYPAVKLYVQTAAGLNNQNLVGFHDALDYIGVSAYPTVDTPSGGGTITAMTAAWTGATANMAAYSQAWGGKPIIYGEVGALAQEGAGYQPWDYTPHRPQSDTDQSTFATACLDASWQQPWFAGANWWTWYPTDNSIAWHNTQPDYTPHPATQTAIATYLGAHQ